MPTPSGRLIYAPDRFRSHIVLEQARSVGLAEAPEMAYAWVLVDLWDGNYQEVLDRLASVSSDVFKEDLTLYMPKAQMSARI